MNSMIFTYCLRSFQQVLGAYAKASRKLLLFPIKKALAGFLFFVPFIFIASWSAGLSFIMTLPEEPHEMGLIIVVLSAIIGLLLAIPLAPWAYFLGASLMIWQETFAPTDQFGWGSALKVFILTVLVIFSTGFLIGLDLGISTWIFDHIPNNLIQLNRVITALLFIPYLIMIWISGRLLFLDRTPLVEQTFTQGLRWSWRQTAGHGLTTTLFLLSGYLIFAAVILFLRFIGSIISVFSTLTDTYFQLSPVLTFFNPIGVALGLFSLALYPIVISAGFLLFLFARVALFEIISPNPLLAETDLQPTEP